MEHSDNHDLKLATTYWMYLTYRKLGNTELANALLQPITRNLRLIENTDYLNLLLLYKGEKKVEKLSSIAKLNSPEVLPTLAYGIGCYYQHQGRFEKANEVFLNTLESASWNSFGYIAAEAELTTIFPVP